ncbi:rhomboid family intramembrane serine protease [Riemerella columbipharyngis]|uniref:Membrane associated serine protease, rhomboid family n=1 Tax=Riemerella columbipharyngis TaxID=1071918 RepID=A0A1G7DK28_9FLAO|nr:rhomboid family intramembrane serine protease [Riemerella columbipharyngis]SDE51869.1 Membrane associated serine protease, rhomboid family [Riemerella columbipharyngis]
MLKNIPPITRGLIIINFVVFILSTYVLPPNISNYLGAYFPLSPNFRSWQIITHMFMHGGWMHIIFNMVALWSFGPPLERILDEKKFVILYFISGIGAFILFNAWNYYQYYELINMLKAQGVDLHEILQYSKLDDNGFFLQLNGTAGELQSFLLTPMVGASGALFGVIAAFTVIYPDAELIFLFIPFPIKAKILFPIIIVGSLFLGIRQSDGDNIAHFAHLGGALVGFILIKIWTYNRFRIN